MKIVRWAGLLARITAIVIIHNLHGRKYFGSETKDRDVLGDLGIDRLGLEDNIRMDFKDWNGFITLS